MNSPLKAALEYAARGWPVLPLNGKKPMTVNGYKNASTDTAQIRAWWSEHVDAWVGIVVGEESGLCVLDVDLRSGGFESLKELQEANGPLPETLSVSTAGGGKHFYFRYAEQAVRSTIAPGLEIKARGGYVVAPPSRNRETGKAYSWDETESRELAELPAWLAAFGRSPAKRSARVGWGGDIIEGARNQTLASLAGQLRGSGKSEDEIFTALSNANLAR